MAANQDIFLRVFGENQAGLMLKQLGQQIGDVDDHVGRVTGSFGALQATAIGAFAIGGVAAFVGWMVGASKEAAEAEQNLRKVSDVIEATGHAAGKSADDVAAMASRYQQSTTFSDDAVLEMSSVLLTFRNVSGQTFDRAAMDILDYSTIMGTEPSKAAIQFGKALQDPISGITALRKAGVTFTDSQKAMIKSFMDVNDLAGAQNIILTELEHEFGGAAAGALDTFGGKVSWLGNMYGELQEAAGGAINESTSMNVVMQLLGQTVIDLTGWISNNRAEFQELVTRGILFGIDAFRVLLSGVGFVQAAFTGLYGTAEILWGALQVLGGWAVKAGGVMAEAFVGVLDPVRLLASGVDLVGEAVSHLPGMPAWDSLAGKIEGLQRQAQGMADGAYAMGDSWIAAGTKAVSSGVATVASIGAINEQYNKYGDALNSAKSKVEAQVAAQGQGVASTNQLGEAYVGADGKLKGLNDATDKGTAAKSKHKAAVDKDAFSQSEWAKFVGDAERALSRQEAQTRTVAEADKLLQAAEYTLRLTVAEGTAGKVAAQQALKNYGEAEKVATKTREAYSKAYEDADKTLGKYDKTLLTVAQAEENLQDAIVNLQRVRDTEGESIRSIMEADQAAKDAKDELSKSIGQQKDALEESKKSMQGYIDVVDGIGSAYENASGKTITGLDHIKSAMGSFASGDIAGALQGIGSAIGDIVGGKTGSAISGTVNGAATGALVGGLPGAVIGGIVGGLSSWLGADSKERAQRNADRQSVYESIVSSGLQGGMFSASLLRAGSYTYSGVGQLQNVNPTKTPTGLYHVSDEDNRLLYDARNWNDGAQELTDLSTAIAVLDTAMASIAAVMTPSLMTTIDQIETKYQYSITQVGQLAELEQARISDLIIAVTGITADGVAAMIGATFSGYEGYATAGDAFAAKMTDAIKMSVQTMAINDLVNTAIMPMLQPVLAGITTKLMAGSLTGADMSTLISQIGTATEAISPLVTSLYNAVHEAGALTSDQAGSLTATVSDLSTTTTDLGATTTDLTATVDAMTGTADTLTAGVADLGATTADLASSAVQMASSTDRQEQLTEKLVDLVDKMVARLDTLKIGVEAGSDAQVAAVVAAGRDVKNIADVLDRVTQGTTEIRTKVVV